jgi:hypothetical protein
MAEQAVSARPIFNATRESGGQGRLNRTVSACHFSRGISSEVESPNGSEIQENQESGPQF